MGHGGFVNGFVSQVRFAPRERFGVAVLANLADGAVVEDMANRIADLLLDVPKRNWTADFRAAQKAARDEEKRKKAEDRERQPGPRGKERASRELQAYASDYENPAYGDLRVTCEDGSLTLVYRDYSIKLKRRRFDTFAGKHDSDSESFTVKGTFVLDAEREVVSVRMLEPFEAEFARVRSGSVSPPAAA